jgi:phage terminase large subunit-like protein
VPDRTGSLGKKVVAWAKAHGVLFDPWQADVIDVFTGTRAHGKRWASPSNYLVVPRQNGKSEILIGRAAFGLFELPERMILFSSHSWASTHESFLRLAAIVEANDDLLGRVAKKKLSASELGFELDDGSRILFLTRSRGSARGFSGDLLVFDEAHFLSEAAHSAIRPALGGRSAEARVQTWYASTAADQMAQPDCHVAAQLRRRGIQGDDDSFGFVEFSADLRDAYGNELMPDLVPPGVATDPQALHQANPGCPGRISLDFLLEEARSLDTRSNAVEHLGIGDWPDPNASSSGVLDLAKWMLLADPESQPLAPVCIGFDVSPDRRRGTVAFAGWRMDGSIHVQTVHAAEGVAWIPTLIDRLVVGEQPWQVANDPFAIVCDHSQEPLAVQVFNTMALGPQPERLEQARIAQACALFVDKVEEGVLRHRGEQVLLDAIRAASTVPVGGDGWRFSRRSSSMDISSLYASVFAVFAVLTLMPDAMTGGPQIW